MISDSIFSSPSACNEGQTFRFYGHMLTGELNLSAVKIMQNFKQHHISHCSQETSPTGSWKIIIQIASQADSLDTLHILLPYDDL